MSNNVLYVKFKNSIYRSHYFSCFAHVVNLAVGAFINGLSPKRGLKSGADKDKPLIPGPLPSRRYDESDVTAVEDDDEEIEALQHELDKIGRSSTQVLSIVNASALLLRVQSFVAKVGSISCIYIHADAISFVM